MPFDITTVLRTFTSPPRQQHSPLLLDTRSERQIVDERNAERIESWLGSIANSETDAIDLNELSRHASLVSSSFPTSSATPSSQLKCPSGDLTTPATSLSPAPFDINEHRASFVSRYPYVSLVGIGLGGLALGALGLWSLRRLGTFHAPQVPASGLASLNVRPLLDAAAGDHGGLAGAGSLFLPVPKPVHNGTGLRSGKAGDKAQKAASFSLSSLLSSPFRRLASFFAAPRAPKTSAVIERVDEGVPKASALAKLGLPPSPTLSVASEASSPLMQIPLHPSVTPSTKVGLQMRQFRSTHPTAPVNALYEARTFTPFAALVHRSAAINNGYVSPAKLNSIPPITCTPLVDDPKYPAEKRRQVDGISESGYVWDIVILDPLRIDYPGVVGERWVQLIRMRQPAGGLHKEVQVKRVRPGNQSQVLKTPYEVTEETWVTQAPVKVSNVADGAHCNRISVAIQDQHFECDAIVQGVPQYRYRFRREGDTQLTEAKAENDADVLHYPLGDASKWLHETRRHPMLVPAKTIAIGDEDRIFDTFIEYPDKIGQQVYHQLSPDQHSPQTWRDAVHIHHHQSPLEEVEVNACEVRQGRWGIEIVKLFDIEGDLANATVRLFRYDVGNMRMSCEGGRCTMQMTTPPRVHVWELDTYLEFDPDTGEPTRIAFGCHQYRFEPSERGWLLCDPEYDQELVDMHLM